MTKRVFSFENITFEYTLVKENRKTIAAVISPDKSVLIKVPSLDNQTKIDDFLYRKCLWILKQKRYFSQFHFQPNREYVSGESFAYLGRTYKLIVSATDTKEQVVLSQGVLRICTVNPDNSLHTHKLVEHWLKMKRDKIFNEQLVQCLLLFDYPNLPIIKIRRLSKRWGSYINNTIVLNPSLIKASKKQISYVIIHELCHVKIKNHTKEFYKLLSSKMPDWEKVKRDMELHLLS